MTVHMMGMTYCTVHHKFQLCTLGDNYINIEPRLMETPFLLYVRLQTEMLTVLTGGSPKAWTTDTCSTLPQACVTVQAMLKTGFVAVTSPQTNRTWFTTTRTLMRKRNIKKKIFNFINIQILILQFPPQILNLIVAVYSIKKKINKLEAAV